MCTSLRTKNILLQSLTVLNRLEESNLILRGTADEASSVVLKGTLVLCLSEPLKIQGIRLRFTGEKRLGSENIPCIRADNILTYVADGVNLVGLERLW